jgi:hypothetical protein
MSPRLRPVLWTLVLVLIAGTAYELVRGVRRRELVDFEVYSRAGGRVTAAEPLYRADDGHYQFKYLPLFAFVAVPFARIDQELAKALWFALTFGLIVAFIRRSIRALPGRQRSERSLSWLTALFLGRFYVAELTLGQANVLFGVLLILALTAVQAGRMGRAGLLTAAATFVKPYGVLFVPWLVTVGGLTAALSWTAIFALGVALPATVYGWHGNIDQLTGWYHTVTDTTPENLMYGQNISVTAMWTKWLGLGPAAVALGMITGFTLVAVVVWVWSRRARVAKPAYLEFALILILVPLLSPQGWDYMLLLATPGVACLLDRFRGVSRPWRIVTGTWLAVIGFTIFDLVGRLANDFVAQRGLISVGVIVLIVSLAHLRARSLA